MPLWAKVDVDMPTDGKLLGQPVVTRHLWTSLILLAKKQDDAGTISGYDCALLAGYYNLPRKAVAAALTYFQLAHMAELAPDGKIRLLNFVKRQGHADSAEAQALRQQKYYGGHREDILNKKRASRVRKREDAEREDVRFPHAEVEVEEEVEEEVDQAVKARATSKSLAGKVAKRPSAAVVKIAGEGDSGVTVPTRKAYEAAYLARYGVTPPSSKSSNGMLAQFLGRIPADDAPGVAEFYVSHNRALYVSAMHPLNLLLRDATKLWTEWKTGHQVTDTEARQIERTQASGDVFKSFLKEG